MTSHDQVEAGFHSTTLVVAWTNIYNRYTTKARVPWNRHRDIKVNFHDLHDNQSDERHDGECTPKFVRLLLWISYVK